MYMMYVLSYQYVSIRNFPERAIIVKCLIDKGKETKNIR